MRLMLNGFTHDDVFAGQLLLFMDFQMKTFCVFSNGMLIFDVS